MQEAPQLSGADAACCVLAWPFPSSATHSAMRRCFEQHAAVRNLFMRRHSETWTFRGFVVVEFDSKAAADKVGCPCTCRLTSFINGIRWGAAHGCNLGCIPPGGLAGRLSTFVAGMSAQVLSLKLTYEDTELVLAAWADVTVQDQTQPPPTLDTPDRSTGGAAAEPGA